MVSKRVGCFLCVHTLWMSLRPYFKINVSKSFHGPNEDACNRLRTQSYDRELQRQRCKFLQRYTGSLVCFENKKHFLLNLKKKLSSLLQRWRCSCKLKNRRIDSGSESCYFTNCRVFVEKRVSCQIEDEPLRINS
jgi:hypothetical protein